MTEGVTVILVFCSEITPNVSVSFDGEGERKEYKVLGVSTLCWSTISESSQCQSEFERVLVSLS